MKAERFVVMRFRIMLYLIEFLIWVSPKSSIEALVIIQGIQAALATVRKKYKLLAKQRKYK